MGAGVAPGDQAEVLESVPHWLKIQLVDGTIGYVISAEKISADRVRNVVLCEGR